MTKYEINNNSFKNGPLFITSPGYYYFTENIVINFYKTSDDFWTFQEGHNFGFMAGIIIKSSDVTIDMSNFSIKQSIQDYCLQRFFALIQLNNMPFNVGAGPILENRKELDIPENIVIKNGTFALTSHQAILGNNNKNLTLSNICIKEFEVSGITLNNVNELYFKNSVVESANINVPVSPFFSAFVFLFRLLQTTAKFANDKEITNKINLIINVLKGELGPFIDIIFKIDSVDELYFLDKYDFFINKKKLSPCNVHGIKITGAGPSVNDLHKSVNLDESLNSNNINIDNVVVKNIYASVDEELSLAYNDKIVHIGAGVKATFAFLENDFSFVLIKLMKELIDEFPKLNDYLKSDLSNPDIFDVVVKIHLEQKLDENQSKVFSILRNSDSMGHINKGVMGVRLGSVVSCTINNLKINKIVNCGKTADKKIKLINNFNIHKEIFIEHGVSGTLNIAGSYSTGIVASAIKKSTFDNIDVDNIVSKHGYSIGLFVNNESDDVILDNIFINKIKSNNKLNDSSTILVDENSKNIHIRNTFINTNKNSRKFKYVFLFFVAIVILYIINTISFSVVLRYLKKYLDLFNE